MEESHELFPSGEWEGFYTYVMGPGGGRHPMSFVLQFQNGRVTGGGSDDIGPFSWNGSYDVQDLQCAMTKHYAGHQVDYHGHADENGIWGTWTIGGYATGGFHIWPKKGKSEETEEEAVQEKIIFTTY